MEHSPTDSPHLAFEGDPADWPFASLAITGLVDVTDAPKFTKWRKWKDPRIHSFPHARARVGL